MIRLSPAFPLVAALLLAACGSAPRTAQAPAQPENPEVAACREEARASASVRDVARQANPNNVNQSDRLRQMQADAEARAVNDCLRRRGVIRGGGVEPVRRPGLAF